MKLAIDRESRARRPHSLPVRLGGIAAAAAAVTLLTAIPASAHVKVSGIDAVPGGSGVVTFRVPSESDTASTTELLISFPASTPFTSVDTQPKAGWTATVTRKPLPEPVKGEGGSEITQYVSQVDLKATGKGAAIPPGEFDMFNLSVGPFPKASSVSFGALQTYSDGTKVNWDEKSADGATEPEHPAPVLPLTAADDGTPPPQPSSATATQAADDSGPDGSSWTGVTGLAVGAVALLVSVVTLVVSRNGRKGAAEQ